MNKFIPTLLSAFILSMGIAQADAALLTDWTYNLNSVSYEDNYKGYGGVTEDGDYLWEKSGGKNVLFEADNAGGTLSFDDGNPVTTISPMTVDSQWYSHVEYGGQLATQRNPLVTLTFDYSVASVSSDVSLNFSYSIPLYSVNSAKDSFVYYDMNEVSVTSGSLSVAHDGYTYSVGDLGFMVDNMPLMGIRDWSICNNTKYFGWVIDFSDRYDYGWFCIIKNTLFFEVEGIFSLAYKENGGFTTINDPTPAPTPEPATMLLTGLGLAGLGAIKRRRSQK